MIDKTQCMYVFLLLYGGAILALFVRAFVRRRLLEYCESLAETPAARSAGGRIERLLLAIPRQTAALRGLGKTLDSAPGDVQSRYRRFRAISGIALTLVALLIVFSFTAHRVCGA
jgi:hypothetical protein